MAIEVYGAGGASKEAEQKTVTPTTSQQTVTPTDEDHELTQVTVNAMPSGALSDITVSAGRITAQVGTAGYLAAGTKKTMDLSKVPAQSYMPGTSDRVIIPANRYTIGAQTLKGDANLIPENIGKGRSIFGVEGIFSNIGTNVWEKYSIIKGNSYKTNSIGTQYLYSKQKLIVFNDEMYLIGNDSSRKQMCKWNGESWVQLADMPGNYLGGACDVYNGELHIMFQYGYLYKWDGIAWTQLTTAPQINICNGSTGCVYNGKFHVMGSAVNGYTQLHYTWDGTTWEAQANLPYTTQYGSCCVYHNKIYLFSLNRYMIYDGSWSSAINNGSVFYAYSSAVSVMGDKIILLGGGGSAYYNSNKNVIEFDGETFVNKGTLSNLSYESISTVYNNLLYVAQYNTAFFGTYAEYTDVPNESLGLVVGNSGEYPVNGIQGGYWYIIYSSYATGTFSFTSAGTSQTVTIPHNLGRIPELLIILPSSGPSYSSSYECIICVLNNKLLRYKSQMSQKPNFYENSSYTADEQNITINGYWLGATYTWLVA